MDDVTSRFKHERERTRTGLDYVTLAGNCSSRISRPDGEVIRRWSYTPCLRWGNSILTPEGHVLAVHEYPFPESTPEPEAVSATSSLLKMGWDGRLLWERRIPAHHDVGMAPGGNIAVLTRQLRIIPELHETIPVRDHFIVLLSPNGEVLEKASLAEIILRSQDVFAPLTITPERKRGLWQIEFVHANSIDWMLSDDLARRDAFYSKENVLVTMRAQNSLVLVNWPRRRIIWSWGQGELSAPHDGNVLLDGNIMVFDNGVIRKWSRVVEIDPLQEKVVWEYKGHRFFSGSRGGVQRLASGNTLVAVSDRAMAFEVTRSGEVVWEYRNPERGRRNKPVAIVRVRNYPLQGTLRPRTLID